MSTDINISYSTVFHLDHIINNVYAERSHLMKYSYAIDQQKNLRLVTDSIQISL